MGHYDIVLFLLQNGADVNISDVGNESPLYVASSSGHYDIVRLLIAHGALSAGNTKSQFKTISKRTKGNEIFSDSNALLNPCGYPEEKISHSKEKQEEEKEGIYVAKAQEGKEETVFTREQEEKEEIICTRETKEENEETIDRRKEQLEKGELVNTRKGEEEIVEVDDLSSFSVSYGEDALLPDVGNMSPLSIAVQKGHFDIVKNIIDNSTDLDLSDTGKSPLFLAAEEGYHDILVLLLHSKYNDIAKTYLDTTPLEIAVWRNNTKVVQLLIQEENQLQKYRGNYHLFEILVDLKRSEFCINEKTDKEDCYTKDHNHRHLPYPLWHILTSSNNDYLIHLLKIGLDINKRDYNGNTLLYKILNRTRWTHVDKFKSLMEHFEDVNVEEINGFRC
jgi:ankyrin repeat protein